LKPVESVERHMRDTQPVRLRSSKPLLLPTSKCRIVANVVGDWTGIPVGRMARNQIHHPESGGAAEPARHPHHLTHTVLPHIGEAFLRRMVESLPPARVRRGVKGSDFGQGLDLRPCPTTRQEIRPWH
jgi:hypothetical protein